MIPAGRGREKSNPAGGPPRCTRFGEARPAMPARGPRRNSPSPRNGPKPFYAHHLASAIFRTKKITVSGLQEHLGCNLEAKGTGSSILTHRSVKGAASLTSEPGRGLHRSRGPFPGVWLGCGKRFIGRSGRSAGSGGSVRVSRPCRFRCLPSARWASCIHRFLWRRWWSRFFPAG